MSQSKIAIVIAPSIATWDRFTKIADVISAVTDAGGMALIIPSQKSFEGIEALLNLADGVVLVCPDDIPDGSAAIAAEDAYVREFGRATIETGINSLAIIGGRNFVGSDKEWQDWAFFLRAGAEIRSLEEVEEIQDLMREFVPAAQIKSAFSRLGRGQRRRVTTELRSPVTHG